MPATALSGAPVLSTARNVSLRGGRDRKMKKPYPCIETKKADPEKRNQIRFFFVGGDDNKSSKYAGAEEGNRIASSYIVMAGDIDPLSGEIITQKMIDEYYKEEDKQIRTNLKFERRGFTNKEQAERRKIKKEFMETFRKEHGHLPSESAVKMYMEEKEGKRWNIMISELVEKGRKDCTDRETKLSVPSVEMRIGEMSLEMQALLDVADSLTDRLAMVLDAMIQHEAGGQERLLYKDVADMWDVKQKRINRDIAVIKKMILNRAEELRKEC